MSKLRKTKRRDGREGKAIKTLNGRIAAYNETINRNKEDAKAYKQPGRGY